MIGQKPKLDEKNLLYLEDTLNYEYLAGKKCDAYAMQFTDQNCKTLSQQLSQHHKKRFDALYDYLNSHQ